MRFDFDAIPSGVNPQKAIEIMAKMVDSITPDDPPYLTDILVMREREGGKVMEMLAHRDENEARFKNKTRMMWPIEVLRDEWGNVPAPGEKVIHRIPINNYRGDGEPIPNEERNVAIASGNYEQKFFEDIEYEIDNYGCIWCPFESAGHFLNNWGIHRKTRAPIMYQIKPEHSVEQAKAPNGQLLYVWYWRYAEVPIEEYANLPKRKNVDGGSRGKNV